MAEYSTTKTFPSSGSFPLYNKPAFVAIDAGTGSVAIEVETEPGNGNWIAIPDSPFSADTSFHLDVAGGSFRFTPSGDAKYGINWG